MYFSWPLMVWKEASQTSWNAAHKYFSDNKRLWCSAVCSNVCRKILSITFEMQFCLYVCVLLGLNSQNQSPSPTSAKRGKRVTSANRGKTCKWCQARENAHFAPYWLKKAWYVCSDWLDYFNQLESLEYTKPNKTQSPAGAVVSPLSSGLHFNSSVDNLVFGKFFI